MCLIIQRDAGIVLPKRDFITAVNNNPDGWGLSAPDCDKKLYTTRSAEKTDGEKLYDIIHGEFKNDKILLHLRYTTAGETVLRNSHPFPVLEKNTDGIDVRMAHNGTLFSYTHKFNHPREWESDTRNFVRSYVRPLFKRLARGMSTKEMMDDPFVHALLDNELTTMSVLSFIDGEGNTMNVNAMGNKGEQRDGYWVSNVYSFDEHHRTPARAKKNQNQAYGTGYAVSSRDDWAEYIAEINQASANTVDNTPSVKKPKDKKHFAEDTQVQRFTVKYALNPTDLHLFSDDSLEELQKEKPEDFMLLVKETLFLLEQQDREITNMAIKLQQYKQVG